MEETTRKTIERIISKQRKFWIRLIGIVVVSCFIITALTSFLVSYLSRYQERKMTAETERTLENFISKSFQIDIPFHYEISADMQVQTETFSKATIYCYSNRVQETDDTPDITATGDMVVEGMIAVSQDNWNKKIHSGDIIYIVKLKKCFIARDTMNIRHKNSFDIFFYKQHMDKMYRTFTSDVIRMRVVK